MRASHGQERIVVLEFVFRGVRCRIASQPEILDEALPFLVRGQTLERLALFIRDDVGDVFTEPFLIGCLELLAELGFTFLPFFLGDRFGHRLPRLGRGIGLLFGKAEPANEESSGNCRDHVFR